MIKIKLRNKIIAAIVASCMLTVSGAFLHSNSALHKPFADTTQNQPKSENLNFAIFITDDTDKSNKLKFNCLVDMKWIEQNNLDDLTCVENVKNHIACEGLPFKNLQNTDQLKNLPEIFEQKGADETVKFLNENFKTNICDHISIKISQLLNIIEKLGKKYVDQNQFVVLNTPEKNNSSDSEKQVDNSETNQQIQNLLKIIVGLIKELKNSKANMDLKDSLKAIKDIFVLNMNC